MEIKEKDIITLKREIEFKRKNKRLSGVFKGKVKLNFALDEEKFFNQLIKAYVKILSPIFADENKLEKIKELINTDNIEISFEPVDASNSVYTDILKLLYKYNYNVNTRPKGYNELIGINIYKVSVFDNINKDIVFYSSFDIPISKKLRSANYTIGYSKVYKIFDVRGFIAELLINKECHNYLKENRETIVYSAIKTILDKGIGTTPRSLKRIFEERLYKVISSDLLNKYYIESLDLKSVKFRTEEFYKSMALLELLEAEDYSLYSGLQNMFSHRKHWAANLAELSNAYNAHSTPISNMTICKLIFKEMNKDNEQIELYEQYIEEAMSDYAKSYQTKKNIPNKVLSAMEQSKFLKHFTYVEYDSDVDLNDIKSIENEFEKISNYLGLKYMPNTRNKREIRFRKLGHHRAGGLYYDFYNCVCVDLNSPNSLLHELSHMLDATVMQGIHLHELFEFRLIAEKYIEEMDKFIDALDNGDPLKAQYYNMNIKYNRNYFTYYPEVFARCSEIYLKRVLNMNTNLLNVCERFCYPENKDLEKMIKDFFESKVFTKIGMVDEKISVAAVASAELPKHKVIEFVLNRNGQFSLF